MQLGFLVSKSVDRGIIELVGPYGLSQNLISISNVSRYYDGGNFITTYALYIIIGLILFITTIFLAININNVLYANIIYLFTIILCTFSLLPKTRTLG